MLLWQGKSRFKRSENISVVAITKTHNEKTGDMVQTFIIPEAEFVRKEDKVNRRIVCGTCPFIDASACYVNVAFSVMAIWKKLSTSGYPALDFDVFKNRTVRLGSYGEPVLMPLKFIKKIVNTCKGWTGYTHAWEKKWAKPYSKYLMASVHTLELKEKANALGWKTFRIIKSLDKKLPDEILCPATPEYKDRTGKQVTCADCLLCCGTSSRSPKNVCIVAHGGKGILTNIRKLIDKDEVND